ncbi:SLAM family member 5-like isoform X2 [Melanotaenia boesemani]|uniref:SLAM family member 5-like isoform X2 n=1 Tax=Melanotaenia boesemani TaxID=1250792 RepID=UPI001C042E68|nr:SLAM family member 5-like isoform X2 [Melanotaenia boesemani]
MLRMLLITGLFYVTDSVIKRDGETVTLNVNTTGLQVMNYFWTFGRHHPVINITIVTNDNGPIRINVLEGNNITLDSGLQELEKDHNVMWTQGQDFAGDQIAQWKDFIVTISESYKGILKMDPTTGDLVFLRVTKSLTGFYCVKIWKGSEPHVLRQYLLTVYETVSVPNITAEPTSDGTCYVSCSVENGPDVTLTWYQGEKQISQTSNNNISISPTLLLEINRENKSSYTCEANNPVSTETTSINSTQLCPPHGSDWNIVTATIVALGVVGGVLLVLAALIVCRKYQCIKRTRETYFVETIQMDSSQNSCEGSEDHLLNGNTRQTYDALDST